MFPRQPNNMNNPYSQNNMLNRYQSYLNNNTPFNNNAMLSNNPVFMSSIKDPNFYQKINANRIEQLRRAKSINDLGLQKDKILEYVIQPMKVNRTPASELMVEYNNQNEQFFNILKAWWESRTNNPYKNILKNENYKKRFDKKEDLVVHKVTKADTIGVMDEWEKLKDIIETHENELKMIYSASEKNKHKKEFEYVNKYKYRLKYEAQNFDDLKEYYKKEQKKLDRQNEMIDNIIARIEDEDLTEEQLQATISNFEKNIQSKRKSDKKKNTSIADIEDEIRREIGDKEFKKLVNEIEREENKESKNKNMIVEVVPQKRIKSTTIATVEDKPKKFKSTTTIKSDVSKCLLNRDSVNIVSVDTNIKEKYKNRKK